MALRHGLTEIPVHEIANQGYCELQVELLHQNPHVVPVSQMLENGNFGHAGLEQRDRDFQATWDSIRRGNPGTLRATFDGVPLVGIPDYLVTGRDGVTLLLEYKFTRRPELYPSRLDQANSYGYLAEANGRCDPKRFVLGVVALSSLALGNGRPLAPRDVDAVRPEIKKQSWAVARELLAKDVDMLPTAGPGWSAHLWPYEPSVARATLTDALAYWKQQRAPRDSHEHTRKCEACPINAVDLCPATQVPTNLFEIHHQGANLVVRRR